MAVADSGAGWIIPLINITRGRPAQLHRPQLAVSGEATRRVLAAGSWFSMLSCKLVLVCAGKLGVRKERLESLVMGTAETEVETRSSGGGAGD